MASKNTQVMLSIEQDIRARGLQPGQPYQSAREVAQMLGVSPMTADRAMRKLAGSGLLQRRHGSGTYIGEGAAATANAIPRIIQVWVPSSFYSLYNVAVERIVKFVHLEFPGDTIQQVFLPDENQLAFCERMAGSWEVTASPRTVVLISCRPAVQHLVRELELPAVATGGVCKGSCEIPWIDMDYRQAGCLLAECVVKNGHKRILVVMNHIWGPGDNEFLEGIEQVIKHRGKRAIDVRVRSVESEPRAIEKYLQRTLHREQPPTALICSSKATAMVAVGVAEKMKLHVPEEFLVGTVRVSAPENPDCRYVYTHWAPVRESDTEFRRIVQQINQGINPTPDHYLIPVELVEPETLALRE